MARIRRGLAALAAGIVAMAVLLSGCATIETSGAAKLPAPTLVPRQEAAASPTDTPLVAEAPAETPTDAPQDLGGLDEPTAIASPASTLAPGARVLIPSLDIDVPLVETSWHIEVMDGSPVAVWDLPTAAAGHHLGSAVPGQVGNCVVSGHSRAEDGGVFYGLWDLEAGDSVVIRDESGTEYAYVVDRTESIPELGQDLAVRQANAERTMGPTQDERLTLVTCWPDWAYTHRLIIVAIPRD